MTGEITASLSKAGFLIYPRLNERERDRKGTGGRGVAGSNTGVRSTAS